MATRVTTWTEHTDFVGTEVFALDDGSTNKKVSAAGLLVPVAGGETATRARNLAVNTDYGNTIEAACHTSVISGGGGTGDPNRINAQAKPDGVDETMSWAADTVASGVANVAVIAGGYDHINNQVAGTISGGGHNYIQSNTSGHSFIGGGSYNWISGGRSAIVGGKKNQILGATANLNFIGGGENNIIDGNCDYGVISGGLDNNITGGGGYQTCMGRANTVNQSTEGGTAIGLSHSITGGGTACTIVGGSTNVITDSNYNAIVGGTAHALAATGSVVIGGSDNDDRGSRATNSSNSTVLVGQGARGMHSTGAIVQGQGTLTSAAGNARCQVVRSIETKTTTGATGTSSSLHNIDFFDTAKTTFTGRVTVTAWNETDLESNGFSMEFVAFWDGTTWLINGAASEPSLTAISNPSALTIPSIGLSTGRLRIRAAYKAGKTVHNAIMIEGVMIEDS